MDIRVVEQPAFRLAGYATRVPLIHRGVNPHIRRHIEALSAAALARLKILGDTEPRGALAVYDDLDPDCAEQSELTYLHGVAVSPHTPLPHDLDVIEVPAGRWAVIRIAGPHAQTLRTTWATAASEWFPAHPWRLRPGPEIVVTLEPVHDGRTTVNELWLPVEAA